MSYFFTPQRPRQPDDDDGGIFNTVMKYVGQAGKGAVIGGVSGGWAGAGAGATLGLLGASDSATATGAKSWSARQASTPSPMSLGQIGPDSSTWANPYLTALSNQPNENMATLNPSKMMY